MRIKAFFFFLLFVICLCCFANEEFYLFDVGQGSCHFAVYNDSKIGVLFDAGSKNSRKLGKIKSLQTVEEKFFFVNKNAIPIDKEVTPQKKYQFSESFFSGLSASLSLSLIGDTPMSFGKEQYDKKDTLKKTREEIRSTIEQFQLKHLFIFLSHPDEDHINLITETKKNKSIIPDDLSITVFLSGDWLGHASSDVSSVLTYLFTRPQTWIELPYYWNYKGSLMPEKGELKNINNYMLLKKELNESVVRGSLEDIYSLFQKSAFPNNTQIHPSLYPFGISPPTLDALLSYTGQKIAPNFFTHISKFLPKYQENLNPFLSKNEVKADLKNIEIYSMNKMFGDINSQSCIIAFYFPSLKLRIICTGDAHPESFDPLSLPLFTKKDYCTALILPHHGASNNFSPKMLEIFQPDVFLISAGLTSYEHPANDLINTYRELYKQNSKTKFFDFYGRTGISNQISTCISRIGKQDYKVVKNSSNDIPFICTNLMGTIHIDKGGFKSSFENILKINDQLYSIDFSKNHKLPEKTEKVTPDTPFSFKGNLYYPIQSDSKLYLYRLHKLREPIEEDKLVEETIDENFQNISWSLQTKVIDVDKSVVDEINNDALLNFSKRYIQEIRNADPERGEVLWGGDIELAEIGKMLNLKFVVYQYARDQQGKILIDKNSNIPIVISNEKQPVGDENGEVVCLWLDGFHYQNYNPIDGAIIDVPKDGNCLFYAVLRAYGEIKKYTSPSTLKEVSQLRNAIADRYANLIKEIDTGKEIPKPGSEENNFASILTKLTHKNDNPIYVRFAAILEAENNAQLQNAVYDLPPGKLVTEVINFRGCFK